MFLYSLKKQQAPAETFSRTVWKIKTTPDPTEKVSIELCVFHAVRDQDKLDIPNKYQREIHSEVSGS